MCLIIVAPKGTDKFSEFLLKAIKAGANGNGDGMGFAYKRAEESKVFIDKGYEEVDFMIETLDKLKLKPEDELIIHFRIKTHGKRNATNMHPFIISAQLDIINTEKGSTDNGVLMHNGVFSSFGSWNSDYSDTWHFTNEFMSVPEIQNLLKRDSFQFEYCFEKIISSNKVAYLFGDTGIITIGKFITDEGYKFSNSGYQSNWGYRNIGGKEERTGDFLPKGLPKGLTVDLFPEEAIACAIGANSRKKRELFKEKNNSIKEIVEKQQAKYAKIGKRIIPINYDSKNSVQFSNEITVSKLNWDEICFKANSNIGSLEEGKTYSFEGFDETQPTVSFKKNGDGMIILIMNKEILFQNIQLLPKVSYEEKYHHYVRLRRAKGPKPSKNFVKKLEKRVQNTKKDFINLGDIKGISTTAARLFYEENKSLLVKSKHVKKADQALADLYI